MYDVGYNVHKHMHNMFVYIVAYIMYRCTDVQSIVYEGKRVQVHIQQETKESNNKRSRKLSQRINIQIG